MPTSSTNFLLTTPWYPRGIVILALCNRRVIWACHRLMLSQELHAPTAVRLRLRCGVEMEKETRFAMHAVSRILSIFFFLSFFFGFLPHKSSPLLLSRRFSVHV